MKTVCASGTTTRGIDIYQGDLINDINKVKASGVVYAFLKAFEYQQDPRFISRWHAMKDDGIIRGAYDFFHPERDPIAQATKFCSIVGALEDTDSAWLDWETTGGTFNATDRANGLKWLQKVEALTGKIPGIYASPSFLQELVLDKTFLRYPLWVAHYGVKCPLVPTPWTNWNFWQTTGTGNVPGMTGHCDMDLFNGSLSDLQTFMKNLQVNK